MNPTAHQTSRPLALRIALTLLVATIGTSLVRSALRADWNGPLVLVKFGSELIMLWVPLWFIFRGKNWARWLLVAYTFGGFCVSLPRLIEHLHSHASSWLLAYGLLNLVVVAALIGLFLPSSTQWFRGHANARMA